MDEPQLASGSQGDWVTYLQQTLASKGYDPGPVDGVFGDATAAAVRAFQHDNGLTEDGTVGPQTWAALLAGATPTVPDDSTVPDDNTVPATLVDAGAPADLSQWTDQQKESYFDGPVNEEQDQGTAEEVTLVAIADGSTDGGQIA